MGFDPFECWNADGDPRRGQESHDYLGRSTDRHTVNDLAIETVPSAEERLFGPRDQIFRSCELLSSIWAHTDGFPCGTETQTQTQTQKVIRLISHVNTVTNF